MKKNIFIMCILAMIISLGLFSCESSDDSGDSGGSGALELVGTWLFDFCDYDAVDDESETDKYVFPSASSGSRTGYSYEGTGCSSNLKYEFLQNFTYQVGDTITTSDNDTAKKINFTTQSVWVTIRLASVVTDMNNAAMCQFTDWALDVPKDITGLTCDGDIVDSQGTVNYDIYKASGSKLYFGDDENDTYEGDSELTRPRKLEGGGYTKQ